MRASKYLSSLSKLRYEQLVAIKGVGPILAQNIIDFVQSNRFHIITSKLETLESHQKGIEITLPKQALSSKLAHEVICITGTFDVSRPHIRSLLEEQGAKVVETVSSSTTLLIAGEKAGSKLAKAEKLNIPIINDYRELII